MLTAPKGELVNAKIAISKPIASRAPPAVQSPSEDANEHRIIFAGHFDPAVNNNGWAGVTRVILSGGAAHVEDGAVVVEGAQSVTLLTRVEWYADFSQAQVDAMVKSVDQVEADYAKLLDRHRQVQAPIFDRVSVDFGGSAQQAMSGEELIDDQRTRQASRLHCLRSSSTWAAIGSLPPRVIISPRSISISISVIAPGTMGALPEAMSRYYDWVESVLPDGRTNASNIFGARGIVFPILPSWGSASASTMQYPRVTAFGLIPIGLPALAGVITAPFGISSWSAAMWSFCASGSCRASRKWLSSTRTSSL